MAQFNASTSFNTPVDTVSATANATHHSKEKQKMRPAPYTIGKTLKKPSSLPPTDDTASIHSLDESPLSPEYEHTPLALSGENTGASNIVVTVPTRNQYETLSNESDTAEDNMSLITVSSKTSQLPRKKSAPAPPPIYVQTKSAETTTIATKRLTQLANNASKNKVIAQLSGQYIALKAKTEEDFELILSSLKAHGYQYFTYKLKRDRPIKVLLRGVPTDWEREDIEDALRESEIPFINVAFLQKRDATTNLKYKLPLVLVNTTKTGADLLYQVEHLNNFKLDVTEYNQTSIAQCYNCQQFGHSSLACHLQANCLKCGAKHATKTCTKDTSSPAKCVNCGDAHPANYRGCTKYQAELQRRQQRQQNRRQTAPPPATLYNYQAAQFPSLPHSSAAPPPSVWGPPQHQQSLSEQNTSNTGFSEIGQIFKEIKQLFAGFNLAHLITTIKTAISKIKNTTSTIDKISILFEAISTLFN